MSNAKLIKKYLSPILNLLVIPLVIVSSSSFKITNYYPISMFILFLSVIAFYLSFEKRKPQPKEIIIIGLLTILAVVSRIVFAPIPFVSPLVAFVIISGIAFGAESAFMCGAISALVSNISMRNGPWTLWQMLSFGICGYLLAVLYQKKQKNFNKLELALVSCLTVQLLGGFILDLSALSMNSGSIVNLSINRLISLMMTGAIPNFIHGLSVGITIYFLATPLLSKINRISEKYGLMER